MKLKVGDSVKVMRGKDKNKVGKILYIDKKNNKLIVEKVNMVTKNIKKRNEKAGERIKKEAEIDVSNVMLICPSTGMPTRIGYTRSEGGTKQRISKKSNKVIEDPSKEK